MAACCLVLLLAACAPERPAEEGASASDGTTPAGAPAPEPSAAGSPASPGPPPSPGSPASPGPPPSPGSPPSPAANAPAGTGGTGPGSESGPGDDTGPGSESGAPALRVHAWDCDNGMYVVTERHPDRRELILQLPRGPLTLTSREAASGARWSNGTVVFWNRGDEARLELGEREVATCRVNHRRSIVEAAKLSGAEVWATGDEPGWTLRIFPQTLVLVTDRGEAPLQMPRPEPVPGPDGAGTLYRAETDEHRLEVELRPETCRDSTSGQEFDTTVRVTLDGKTYRGCGLLLVD